MKRIYLSAVLAGCGGPHLTITEVQPTTIVPGETIEIRGSGFVPGTQVQLLNQDQPPHHATELHIAHPGKLRANTPPSIHSGSYQLVVNADNHSASLPHALQVVLPATETPCAGVYTTNATFSHLRKEVVIDRAYPNGEHQVLRTPLSSITQVEYETLAHPSGFCSVIFLRKTDTTRIRYADDTFILLGDRARKLATDMNKPLVMTTPHRDNNSVPNAPKLP